MPVIIAFLLLLVVTHGFLPKKRKKKKITYHNISYSLSTVFHQKRTQISRGLQLDSSAIKSHFSYEIHLLCVVGRNIQIKWVHVSVYCRTNKGNRLYESRGQYGANTHTHTHTHIFMSMAIVVFRHFCLLLFVLCILCRCGVCTFYYCNTILYYYCYHFLSFLTLSRSLSLLFNWVLGQQYSNEKYCLRDEMEWNGEGKRERKMLKPIVL